MSEHVFKVSTQHAHMILNAHAAGNCNVDGVLVKVKPSLH